MLYIVESIVFGTGDLSGIRSFYEHELGFVIAEYKDGGAKVVDQSERHVNYTLGSLIIGFEESNRIDTGGMVIQTDNFLAVRDHFASKDAIRRDGEWFIIVSDPEDRELIIEDKSRRLASVS